MLINFNFHLLIVCFEAEDISEMYIIYLLVWHVYFVLSGLSSEVQINHISVGQVTNRQQTP